MIIHLDAGSGVPVYRQIAEQIRVQIMNGLLAPGTELPSTRELSKKLSVNPMTVSKSYSRLEKERFLEGRPGLTLIVAERPPPTVERSAIQQLKAALEPAATLAGQLGISPKKARGVFRKILKKTGRHSEKDIE
jgi:GntR family transcriptional regulator